MRTPPRMISPPVRLHWAGWTSDTYTLQQNGWEISVHENFNEQGLQIALRHRGLDVRGLSNMTAFDHYGYHVSHPNMVRDLVVRVMGFAPHFRITTTELPRAWTAIDASPSIMRREIIDIDDLALFQPLPPPENDVIIEPPSFDEILQMALEHQAPKQKELRAKARQKMGAILRIAA